MTREEWLALPTATRLDVIYAVLHDRLVTVPVPSVQVPATSTASPRTPPSDARSPKYDAKLARRGGFVFMSEMLLHDLEWWLAKKKESVASGGRYAEKDAKTVAELERWIAWRTACPGEAWTGVRGDRRVTALPPARDPELHEWGPRAPARLEVTEDDREPASGGFSDQDYGASADEDIPF